MSWLDYVLLALVLGYVIYLIFFRKKKHCGGCCETCSANCKAKE